MGVISGADSLYLTLVFGVVRVDLSLGFFVVLLCIVVCLFVVSDIAL